MDRGGFMDRTEAEKNTLADIIDRYLREVTPTKRGSGPEASRLNAMRARPLSQLKMSALSSSHVAAYRDDRLKQVSSGTVNKELNHLSHIIETARREWNVSMPENPVRLVRRPATSRARDRRLAIETAMRQGELVSLQWKHIDLKKRTAFLPDTKNGESRAGPLSSEAVRIFKSWPRSTSGVVFPGVTTEAVKRAFIRATRRAELENFHFHDLRHEATSRLVEHGLEIMQVAKMTRHKTLQLLMRYTHLRAGDVAKELR